MMTIMSSLKKTKTIWLVSHLFSTFYSLTGQLSTFALGFIIFCLLPLRLLYTFFKHSLTIESYMEKRLPFIEYLVPAEVALWYNS